MIVDWFAPIVIVSKLVVSLCTWKMGTWRLYYKGRIRTLLVFAIFTCSHDDLTHLLISLPLSLDLIGLKRTLYSYRRQTLQWIYEKPFFFFCYLVDYSKYTSLLGYKTSKRQILLWIRGNFFFFFNYLVDYIIKYVN